MNRPSDQEWVPPFGHVDPHPGLLGVVVVLPHLEQKYFVVAINNCFNFLLIWLFSTAPCLKCFLDFTFSSTNIISQSAISIVPFVHFKFCCFFHVYILSHPQYFTFWRKQQLARTCVDADELFIDALFTKL